MGLGRNVLSFHMGSYTTLAVRKGFKRDWVKIIISHLKLRRVHT